MFGDIVWVCGKFISMRFSFIEFFYIVGIVDNDGFDYKFLMDDLLVYCLCYRL